MRRTSANRKAPPRPGNWQIWRAIAEIRERVGFLEGEVAAEGEYARVRVEHSLLVANYAILVIAAATLIVDLVLRFVRF